MRREPTDAERRLWAKLRNYGLGVRFVRQLPIGPYIADFACRAAQAGEWLNVPSPMKWEPFPLAACGRETKAPRPRQREREGPVAPATGG
jgi:uncharacterized protein DUF559